MMIPASAASSGPRRDDSSQGWTTTVVAAATVLALAISRSYLDAGGSPAGPIAARVPISLYFSVSMLISQSRTGPSRRPCLRLRARLAKGKGARCLIEAEQARDLAHPHYLRVGLFAARCQHLADQIECRAAGRRIARQH